MALTQYDANSCVLIKRCLLLILVCSYNLLKMLSLRQWQPNRKCTALPHPCTGHLNLSVVGLDKRLCDRQSQPNSTGVTGSIFVDPIEALKNIGNVF